MTRIPRQTGPRCCAAAILVAVTALCCASCGKEERKPVFRVRGQVFVNKQPAENAVVVLQPVDEADAHKWPQGYPRASVGEDGSFAITTYEPGDGAPSGKYAVLIYWPRAVAEGEEPAGPDDRLGGRYNDPSTPKFRIEVKEAPLDLLPYYLK